VSGDASELGLTQQVVSAAGSRGRVLVVDDDPSVTRLLEIILQREGYECSCAETVADAMRSLQAGSYDVMVSDVRLPDGSGLDLVAAAIAEDPSIAALVISGLDDVGLADRALRVGAYG
jgi:two-component system response regulator PilR (NtrC family)